MIHTGCNLRCDHCAVFDNDFVAAHRGVRSLADIEQVVSFIAHRGIRKVVVSGGEPTLSRWCSDVIRRLAQERVEFSMSTNATTLTPARVARLRAAGLRKATVSLDGATPLSHDALRGAGTFERAMAGAARLVDAGIAVSIGTFLREDTLDEIAELASISRTLGARRLSLFYTVQRGRSEEGDTAGPVRESGELLRAMAVHRLAGLRVTVHAPRCDADDCPSGQEIFGAIGGRSFEHCVYKHRAAPRLAMDMLAA